MIFWLFGYLVMLMTIAEELNFDGSDASDR